MPFFVVGGITPLSVPFTPLALFSGGEKGYWLDFTDTSHLWQDTSATTPVTANGNPIGRVDDKSGNGNHHIQATSGAKPLYDTTGGFSTGLPDNVDDYLACASVNLTGGQIVTAIWGGRPDKSNNFNEGYWDCSDGSASLADPSCRLVQFTANPDITAYLTNDGGNTTWVKSGASVIDGTSGLVAMVVTSVHDLAEAAQNIRVNGVAGALGFNSGGSTPANYGTRTSTVMAINGPGLFSPMRVTGLILVNRALTTTERNNAEQWMAAKCGASF